jgi:hypothetical protein
VSDIQVKEEKTSSSGRTLRQTQKARELSKVEVKKEKN